MFTTLRSARSLLLTVIFPLALAADETLSFYDVIDQALLANPDLLVERENVQISEEQILRELGEFGWKIEASIDEHRSWDPLNARELIAIGNIQLPGNETKIYHEHRQTLQSALKKRFELGTEIAFRANASRLVNSTNQNPGSSSNNTLFTPEYENFLGLSISQPLWQGGGYQANHARIELAEIKADAAVLLARVKAMNLVAEVASRYLDVVAADDRLEIRKDIVQRALGLVERNQRRQDVGVGVEIDVTTAELAVSQRRSELIDTATEKVERLNNLLALIDRSPFEVGSPLLLPVDDLFSADAPEAYDLGALTSRARAIRLDLAYYRRVVSSAELNVSRVKDATNPKLDLTASYGVTGLSGNFDGANQELGDRQGEEWSIGLMLKMDLEGKARQSSRRVAERQLYQAQVELSKAERGVALEIDTALRRVESARQRLATAREAAALAEKRMEQELQALEQGKGDLYRVVEQQQVFGDAQAEVVSSRTFLQKATIALWMSSGEILNRLHIEPEQVSSLFEIAPSGVAIDR